MPVGEECNWWRLGGYETYNEDRDEDGDGNGSRAEIESMEAVGTMDMKAVGTMEVW